MLYVIVLPCGWDAAWPPGQGQRTHCPPQLPHSSPPGCREGLSPLPQPCRPGLFTGSCKNPKLPLLLPALGAGLGAGNPLTHGLGALLGPALPPLGALRPLRCWVSPCLGPATTSTATTTMPKVSDQCLGVLELRFSIAAALVGLILSLSSPRPSTRCICFISQGIRSAHGRHNEYRCHKGPKFSSFVLFFFFFPPQACRRRRQRKWAATALRSFTGSPKGRGRTPWAART